jgi:hypothetical protein
MVNEPAVASEKPQEQINKLSEQQIIDNILANMPSTEEIAVEVPSLNKFYTLHDPGKPISLRPMTFEDEKIMASNLGGVDALNVLLTRCLSNIKVDSLLQMDKLYLIMKLREISYGDDYQASITCSECGKENKVKFTLSNLPVKYIEETLTDPQIIHLPVLDKEVKVRLPRVRDENYFSNAQQAIGNLWRFVESIDNCQAKTVISKVIPQLPLKDAHVLLEAMGTSEYGLDTKVKFICNYCSNSEIMELPITADFFTSK